MTANETNDPGTLRVGDADRKAALDRLGLYFAGGHLDVAEFDERSGKAAIAKVRGDIDALFVDLPPLDDAKAPASRNPYQVETVDEAQGELDRVMKRAQVVQKVDAAVWGATMVIFFVSLFVLHWQYFWLVFPIAGVASGAVRRAFRLTPEEEELYEKLSGAEQRERMQRLEQAADKRRELGY